MPRNQTVSREQFGSTMLEVLISIAVLSFGMLGMLGMIINGLKMSSSSNYRTIAAQELTAMADFINANPGLTSSYASLASSTITASCLTVSGCTTSTQLPVTDYGLWLQRLGTVLPSGTGVVCLDSSPGDGSPGSWQCDGNGRPTIKICWDETRVALSQGSQTCMSVQV